MDKLNFSVIILAAGIGKRMKSEKSKVLMNIAGKPMILRTIENLKSLNTKNIVVVANKKNLEFFKNTPGIKIEVQQRPLGTADATSVGLKELSGNEDVAVLYGDDTAFYKPQTIKNVHELHKKTNAQITFVTLKKENPKGLGRIKRDKDGKLEAIVEEKDATVEELKINEVNDGLYFFKKDFLKKNLISLAPSKATGELYVTDLIQLALSQNKKVETFLLEDPQEWHGVNTPLELAKANLKLNKSIHIMGASGAGASAVAGIAKEFGYNVTGCDINPDSSYTKNLKIKIEKNHSEKHLENISCLITSPAVLKLNDQNVELLQAKEKDIPALTWQEFLGGILQEGKFNIAVAGAYGKSTTTAMVSQILIDAGLEPTCEVGAVVNEWGTNYKVGKSKYFVCEADEYNDNFLNYHPSIAIVLSVTWDHPDYFKNENQLLTSYINFVNNIQENGTLITTEIIAEKIKTKVRGDIKIYSIKNFSGVKLQIIGDFRYENVNAALTLSEILKLELAKAKISLSNFKGLKRRLEFKGKTKNVEFYDDYAVQPYTIEKTAKALKELKKHEKMVLIVEPHTFTRVNKFFDEYISSLKSIKVEQIYVTDVFPAREHGDAASLSQKLVAALGENAKYSGSIERTVKLLENNLEKYSVVCTMGAGDVYKIYDLINHG